MSPPIHNPEAGSVFESKGGTQYRLSPVKPSMPEPTPMADEQRRPEPITQAKFLGWIIAANAALVLSGVSALVAVLWNQNTTMVKVVSSVEFMASDLASVKSALATGTSDRYRSTDAATDRAALLQTFNTTREAWAVSWKAVIDANTEQSRQIDDLRQKVTRLEAMEGRKP